MSGKRHLLAPEQAVSRARHESRNAHAGAALLLTGLPAAGKSTLAQALHARLFERGARSLVLDGDALRGGLCRDLGFSEAERQENLRRAGEVAALLVESGVIVILALIAPLASQRALLAGRLGDDYREIWCRASLEACERRDPKGHYALARRGTLAGFTGISAPYEPPAAPDLVLDCESRPVEENVTWLLRWLGVLRADD